MPKKTKKSVGPEKPAKTLIQSTIKDMLRKKVSEKHHNLLDEDDVLQDDSNVEDDTNVEDVSMASLVSSVEFIKINEQLSILMLCFYF